MKNEIKKSNRHRRLAFQELDDIAAKIIGQELPVIDDEKKPPGNRKKKAALKMIVTAGIVAAH